MAGRPLATHHLDLDGADAPVAFYPFAKTLWLAADLIFRPLALKDLAGHGENTKSEGAGPVAPDRPPREPGNHPDGPSPSGSRR
jgi:hypothetical protein